MPATKKLSVSLRNLIWAVIVLIAAVIGFLIGGWKLCVAAAVVALIVSEVVERTARSKR